MPNLDWARCSVMRDGFGDKELLSVVRTPGRAVLGGGVVLPLALEPG